MTPKKEQELTLHIYFEDYEEAHDEEWPTEEPMPDDVGGPDDEVAQLCCQMEEVVLPESVGPGDTYYDCVCSLCADNSYLDAYNDHCEPGDTSF